MMHSMTGFARAESHDAGGQLRWELRSVNHRYLDIQFRLPEGQRHLEPELRELMAATLSRGKVDATLSLHNESSGAGKQRLNLEVARTIISQVEAVAGELQTPAPVDPAAILRWPGVLEDEPAEDARLNQSITDTLANAVAELAAARAREGSKIEGLLESRCAEILELVADVQARLPDVLADIRTKLLGRIATLETQVDNDRVEQELVILAQKLDVSEELDRLQAHVAEVRATFDQAGPVGRRLDFLMQELNREANTLASKSADSETTRKAVDLKVIIEQMREQVQNVE